MAGEDLPDQVHRPLLQEFVTRRVRRVREGLRSQEPSLVQSQALLVYQNSQELHNSYRGMRVIQLDCYLLWKLCEISLMCLLKPAHNILDTGCTEEVLLLDYVSLHLL